MSGTFTPDKPSGVFTPDPPPSWDEALSAIPELYKANLQQSIGGWTQMLGDLTNRIWGDESVRNVGRGIAESGRINAELGTPGNMTFPQQSVVQGGASVMSSATMLPLGPVRGVAALGAVTAGSTYDEARRADLSPGRALAHSVFEGVVEAATEYLPAKALFASHKNVLAKTIAVLSREYPGELLATALQNASAKLGYRPDMTAKEFVDDLLLTVGATTVSAPLMAIGASGIQRGAMRLQRSQVPQSHGGDPGAAQPPVYPNTGVEVQETALGQDTTNVSPIVDPNAPILPPSVKPEEKTRIAEGRVLTPENVAELTYQRLQERLQRGDPVTATDQMWMKWYENGRVTERPMAPVPQVNPVEEATTRLQQAAAQGQQGLILPTSVITPPVQLPGETAPTPEPSVVVSPTEQMVPTITGPETKAEVMDTGTPPIAEIQGGTLPGAVTDITEEVEPKSADKWASALKVVMDQVTIRATSNGYVWEAAMVNPRMGNVVNIASGTLPDSNGLRVLLGDAVTDKLVEEVRQNGVARVHDVDYNFENLTKQNLQHIEKIHQIRNAMQNQGTSNKLLPRVHSVPNILSTYESSKLRQKYVAAHHDKTGVTYDQWQQNHKGGEVILTANSERVTPFDKKLQVLLQKWVTKYSPQSRVVLMRGDSPHGRNVRGTMFPGADGTYYIYISSRGLSEFQQMETMAHEFGHVLITDQFYNATAQQQAAMFADYQQYLQDVTASDFDTFQAMAYGIEPFAKGVKPSDARSTRKLHNDVTRDILSTDARTYKGYTLSFDEYYAQQFAKYAIEEGELQVDQSTMQVFQDALAKVKQFFTDFGKYFAPNKSFKQWVQSLAQGATVEEPPQLTPEEQKQQKKLRAMLRKGGLSPEDIHALEDDNGLLDETRVRDVLGMDSAPSERADVWPGVNSARGVEYLDAIARVNPQVGDSVTRFNWFIGKFNSLLQITKMNLHVPGMTAFTDGMRRMFATKAHWTSSADTRIGEWQELGKEQSDKLSKLLLEEARTGTFVGAVVQNGTSSREQTYVLDPQDMDQLGIKPETAELYAKIHGDYLRALNAMELRAIEELWRVYAADDYYQFMRSGGTPEGLLMLPPTHPMLAQHIQNTNASFASLREKPYLPFTRFGRYATLVKATGDFTYKGKDYRAGQTVYFSAFDTTKERNKDIQDMKAELEYMPVTVSGVYIKDEEYNMRGLPPALANALKVRLQLTAQQADDLNAILADMTSSQAFVKHLQKRKGVEGYSEDVMRVYADYFLRFSNYLSRLQHGHELDNALLELGKSAQAITDAGGISDKRDMLHEWLFKLREYVMKPQSELEDLRGVLTVSYLMFNVKSAIVNGFQVPFVTVPYLSARHDWNKAFGAVQKSYKDVLGSWKQPNKLSTEEWRVLQQGLEDGFLDESFASALANTAEGGNLLRALPTTRAGKSWEWVKTKGMVMFQRMEEVNRRVTFIAAYRLNREAGMSEQAAYQEARKAIEDTQNEYARWNRPEFMRGPVKSLMFMFMQYQQNMIFQMYGGDKSWARLMGVHLALAGLLGLPFMGNIEDLVKWFGKLFGEHWDLQHEARSMINDIGLNPDWFMNGTSHNFFGVDLSGSLNMGRPIPGTEALANEGRFPERMLNATSDIGGAGVGFVLNILQAIADDNPDTFMRVQRAMPTFIQNAMKGVDELEHGGRMDRSGALVTEVSPTEAVLHGVLGFNPAQAAAESREFHAKKQLAQYWLSRRTVLLSQYYYASAVINDREAAADVRAAIKDFNSEVPDRALNITSSDLSKSVKARARVREGRESGVPLGKKTRVLSEEVEQLYQTDN